MALVICPKCGKDLGRKPVYCPYCDYTFELMFNVKHCAVCASFVMVFSDRERDRKTTCIYCGNSEHFKYFRWNDPLLPTKEYKKFIASVRRNKYYDKVKAARAREIIKTSAPDNKQELD